MIILPDKNIPRSRFLMPVPHCEWRTPSQAQPKDQFGNENQTRFRVTARLNDGYRAWVGWFDDRSDCDAFLWAIACGSLQYECELWELPTPAWSPDMGDALTYEFATTTFLTSPTGSNQTYTSPSDWNNSNNSIEVLGGGATGALSIGTDRHATGGGGGAYAKILNFTFATPGTTTATYRVGAGGTGLSNSSSANTAGNDGGATWFNSSTDPGAGTDNSKAGAQPGLGGASLAGNNSGGAGGVGTSGWGQTRYSGGNGGNLTGASGRGGSGGGGAGGPNGAGLNGGDSSSTVDDTVTSGGNADNGSGGAGSAGSNSTSAGNTSDGGSGTEWDGTHGCGGGSGGRSASASVNFGTGAGGQYGGGSGGTEKRGTGTGSTGAGGQGMIVVTYTPGASPGFNMPMMGM